MTYTEKELMNEADNIIIYKCVSNDGCFTFIIHQFAFTN